MKIKMMYKIMPYALDYLQKKKDQTTLQNVLLLKDVYW